MLLAVVYFGWSECNARTDVVTTIMVAGRVAGSQTYVIIRLWYSAVTGTKRSTATGTTTTMEARASATHNNVAG